MNAFFRLFVGAVALAASTEAGLGQLPPTKPLGSAAQSDQWEYRARTEGDALIPTCRFEDARCGYIDRNGNTVIAPQFDWVDRFLEGRALVGQAGKYGAIDETGRFVIAPVYDSMSSFDHGQAQVLTGDQLGIIDQDGRWVLPAEHGPIVRISDEVFLVAEPQYRSFDAELRPLNERLSRSLPLAPGKRWGIVARGGKWIVRPTFAQVSAFSDDLDGLFWATVSADSSAHWRLMRADGTLVSDNVFDFVEQIEPDQDRAVVQRGGRWGAINGKGEIAVELKFDWLGYFRDGWAPYRLAGRQGRIDRDGNILPDAPAPSTIHPDASTRPLAPPMSFSEGLAASFDDKAGKWGFADAAGKFVITPQFDAVGHFSKGVAWAAFPDRREWCLIDKRGRVTADTSCGCGQPLVIIEHYRPPPDVACYDDGIRIVHGLPAVGDKVR